MLGHQSRLRASAPDVEHTKGLAKKAREAQRGPQDLTASLSVAPVDLDHRASVPRATRRDMTPIQFIASRVDPIRNFTVVLSRLPAGAFAASA